MDALDQQVIDRDPPGFAAALREGVFGAPLPPAAHFHAWFAAHVPAGPWRITAVQTTGTLPAARPPAWTWLLIHPGIAYLVSSGRPPLARLRLPGKPLVGESQEMAGPLDLVHGVQQALVSLRRRELAAVARRHGQPPEVRHEHEARDLTVARLRAGGDWAAAFAWWSEIVLLRHQYQINSIRRKLVELLALATCGIDRDFQLSWPFRACIDAIYATYALTPLMAVARDGLAAIAPRLAAPPPAGAWPPTLARALAWLEEHQHEAVSLRHAARAAGVSTAHLARLARAALGRSVLEHLTDLRLARARELLASGDQPVARVAELCGFPSHEHFHRVFRRHTGTTPGAWRSAHQAGPGHRAGAPRRP